LKKSEAIGRLAAESASEKTPNCSKPYSMNYENFYSLLQPLLLAGIIFADFIII
jgi:hypothetical protein